MTYIVRIVAKAHRGQPSRERFFTTEPAALIVTYKEIHRRVGKMMGMSVVEGAGWDKSTVTIKSKALDYKQPDKHPQTSRGDRSGISWFAVKLLDRHKSLRVLQDDDLAAFAAFDIRIAEKEAELKAIRAERHEAVAEAWKRAEKVGISELEELAEVKDNG